MDFKNYTLEIEEIKASLMHEKTENEKLKKALVEEKKLSAESKKCLVLFKEKTLELLSEQKIWIEHIENEAKNREKHVGSFSEKEKKYQKEIATLKQEIVKLKNRLEIVSKQLDALSNSKLGKVTKKYWYLRTILLKRVK